jgi:hypothetical protein
MKFTTNEEFIMYYAHHFYEGHYQPRNLLEQNPCKRKIAMHVFQE